MKTVDMKENRKTIKLHEDESYMDLH